MCALVTVVQTCDLPISEPIKGPAVAAAGNAHEFSVSELSFALKRTVEETFGHVRVRGEITGFRGPHSSGHCYFALKDESARLEAVIWKGAYGKMRFKPAEEIGRASCRESGCQYV